MLGIIFDCDGTLIDSESAHFLSWQKAVHKRGSLFTKEEYFPLAGNTSAYISNKLHEKTKSDSPEALKNDKKDYYLELHHQGISPIERTVSLVRKLSQKKEELGIKLAVASAASKDEILINLRRLGLLHVFDAVVSGVDDLMEYSDPEGVNKPKPYIYLHAAKLLGLAPSQCVAFEDSATGVLAAVRAGMTTFAVPNEFTKFQDFSHATHVIDSSTQIELDDLFQKLNS